MRVGEPMRMVFSCGARTSGFEAKTTSSTNNAASAPIR